MLGLGAWSLVMQDEVVAKLERWLRAQVETHRRPVTIGTAWE